MLDRKSKKAYNMLGRVYGEKLWYGIKSQINSPPYYFGFGGPIRVCLEQERVYNMPIYSLLAQEVDVLSKQSEKKIISFRKDTDTDSFDVFFHNHLENLCVESVEISRDNCLWIDLGECWIVFLTTIEKSWQFTCLEDKFYHLTATNSDFSLSIKTYQDFNCQIVQEKTD